MYNSSISDNDDDLFAPKQETSSTSSTTNFTPNVDSLTKELEDLFDKNKSSFSNQIIFKAKLFSFINQSSSSFLTSLDSGSRSLFNMLNEITAGTFGKRYYADVLEETISRTMLIHHFFHLIMTSTSDEHKKVFEFLSNKLNVQLDSHFFTTYVSSFMEVMDFKIEYNTSIYLSLCAQIERTPLDYIVNRTVSQIDSALINYDLYIEKYFLSIRSELGMEY